MKVLVDTSVWSLALRHRPKAEPLVPSTELSSLVEERRVAMIGPVRQEILSGVKERTKFDQLKSYLRAFPDMEMTSDVYEQAASFFNRCREKGIQGSNTDFLICAVATQHNLSVFTVDHDFNYFARVLPIRLHHARIRTDR